jgi:transcriptional regulator with XRE-family HTH domain
MNLLRISENLVKLRHGKKVTQEEIASFLNVTKASVSKWENGQSMPDIQLLPQIAVYFGVSVDHLLGYEPQLSKEQIQTLYQELAKEFATKPFEETMDKCKSLIHQYYSCYPFLLQVSVLWLNHFMLAEAKSEQQEILIETAKLCQRILKECKIIKICNQALSLKAVVDLQLGKPQNVVESLEEMVKTQYLTTSNDMVLIQAFQMLGENHKAKSSIQISMYLHLLELVNIAIGHLTINTDNLTLCEETIRRISCIISAYALDKLHPNSAAQFYYQAAVVYALHKEQEKALEWLSYFVHTVNYLLTGDNIILHGDSYFNALDSWFLELGIDTNPPRNKKLVLDNVVQSFDHPAFSEFNSTDKFIKMKQIITEGGH